MEKQLYDYWSTGFSCAHKLWFFNNLLLIMCMCITLYKSSDAWRGHKRAFDSLELEIQVVGSCPVWLLGTELLMVLTTEPFLQLNIVCFSHTGEYISLQMKKTGSHYLNQMIQQQQKKSLILYASREKGWPVNHRQHNLVLYNQRKEWFLYFKIAG